MSIFTQAAGPSANRRAPIANASEDPTAIEEPSAPVAAKSPATHATIKSALKAHFLFSTLDAEDAERCVGAMDKELVGAGNFVIRQGDTGDKFYVLEAGTCDIMVNDQKVAECQAGDAFGELALMYNAPRAASIVATSPCTLWFISRRTFHRILAKGASSAQMARCEFLKQVKQLEPLSSHQISQLAAASRQELFDPETYIIRQGDEGDTFYLIEEGRVKCTHRRSETDDGHITVPSGSERDVKASKNLDDTHRLATSAASFAASSVATCTSDGHNGDGVDANGDELTFPQRCLRVWSRSETVTVRRRRVTPSAQPAAEQGTTRGTTTPSSTVTSGTTASTDEDASVGAGEGKGTSKDTGKVVLRRRFRVHRFDVIVPLDVLLDRAEDDGTEEHDLDFGHLPTGDGAGAGEGVGLGLGGGGGSEGKADGCVNQTTTLIQLAFPLYKQARRGLGVERDEGDEGEGGEGREDGEGGEVESGGGVRSEYVFAHLPVCRSGLPFLVCADWELVSSREQIHGDASWNLWLRDQVSE